MTGYVAVGSLQEILEIGDGIGNWSSSRCDIPQLGCLYVYNLILQYVSLRMKAGSHCFEEACLSAPFQMSSCLARVIWETNLEGK